MPKLSLYFFNMWFCGLPLSGLAPSPPPSLALAAFEASANPNAATSSRTSLRRRALASAFSLTCSQRVSSSSPSSPSDTRRRGSAPSSSSPSTSPSRISQRRTLVLFLRAPLPDEQASWPPIADTIPDLSILFLDSIWYVLLPNSPYLSVLFANHLQIESLVVPNLGLTYCGCCTWWWVCPRGLVRHWVHCCDGGLGKEGMRGPSGQEAN